MEGGKKQTRTERPSGEQKLILLNFMEQPSSLARNQITDPAKIKQFWTEIMLQLNSNGAAVKGKKQWQRVSLYR